MIATSVAAPACRSQRCQMMSVIVRVVVAIIIAPSASPTAPNVAPSANYQLSSPSGADEKYSRSTPCVPSSAMMTTMLARVTIVVASSASPVLPNVKSMLGGSEKLLLQRPLAAYPVVRVIVAIIIAPLRPKYEDTPKPPCSLVMTEHESILDVMARRLREPRARGRFAEGYVLSRDVAARVCYTCAEKLRLLDCGRLCAHGT